MKNPKDVLVFTGSDADWGLLKPIVDKLISKYNVYLWVMDELQEQRYVKLQLEYKSSENIELMHIQCRTVGMMNLFASVSTSLAKLGIDIKTRLCDAIILGDRVEMLAAAMWCTIQNIPVHHLFAGDDSGCIDDRIRDAITALADYVYAVSENSYERCEHLQAALAKRERILDIYKCRIDTPTIDYTWTSKIKYKYVVARLHPDTANNEDIDAQVSYIVQKAAGKTLFVFPPNKDDGKEKILLAWDEISRNNSKIVMLQAMYSRAEYLGIIQKADLVIGNSSSFVYDTALVGQKNVELVGTRQKGRSAPDLTDAKLMSDVLMENI